MQSFILRRSRAMISLGLLFSWASATLQPRLLIGSHLRCLGRVFSTRGIPGVLVSLCHRIVPRRMVVHGRLRVVAAAEEFLEPDVQADKQVTASHFLNLKFRLSGSAIAPCDGNCGPGVSANDCL